MKKKTTALSILVEANKKETFLPVFLVSISLLIALVAQIVDKFIYPVSQELLSPMIAQIIILFVPLYLCLTVAFPEKSPLYMLRSVGFQKLGADHVFLIIFTTLFMISTSLVLNLAFGGVYSVSDGVTLFGTFTAGEGAGTSSYLYVIAVYAIAPAFIEEVLFRGFIYTKFAKISDSAAILLSAIISSLFAFTLIGLPTALFCALAYCFIRYTTKTLWACMIVHFVFNLYALFVQTNVAKYYLSSQNNALLIICVVVVWLICSALFSNECARFFKAKADKIKDGQERSNLPTFTFKKLLNESKSIFSHKPTMICAIAALFFFAAITAIGYWG